MRAYKMIKSWHLFTLIFVLTVLISGCQNKKVILYTESTEARVEFGIERLTHALEEQGYYVDILTEVPAITDGPQIAINIDRSKFNPKEAEAFSIKGNQKRWELTGASSSGLLYGLLELAERVQKNGKLPDMIDICEAPQMVLRGAAIGVQKTEILPGRHVYEYPYTPENFPWFYNKELWVKYLDMLVENRMNSLYLWNGHPFASLVKLKDYPYALEVDDETFKKNEEMFGFITEEADKRGIFVIQMFYNIIVSKPFAERHNIKTQDRSRPIIPVISDYTRKSIAAFIEKYPNVGLLVALGEAMSGVENDVKWFTETIIPGVKDGLKALDRTDEPPILLRAHDTDAKAVMDAALPIYSNLYTMSKYNGESLTTYEPRGPWTETHQGLSALGSVHIENVHILANLEPFRYASPDFIQKSVKAMHHIHGANGLHLYPQASYWDWPYAADKADSRLLQIDRDKMWYQIWARYAWNVDRDRNEEVEFWSSKLANTYGCGETGKEILKALEESGEIAPKLLRRFGITDGNRQSLTLGMFMSQLINPKKWRIYQSFYASNGPKGEILIEYAEKETKGLPHVGETPPQIIAEVLAHGKAAKEAIDKATDDVKINKEEFKRLKNDIYSYYELAAFFHAKVKAAMLVLQYKYDKNPAHLQEAMPWLEKSVQHYGELTDLTKEAYLYANSMQTNMRRIPADGTKGINKHWTDLLPQYKEELEKFKNNVKVLTESGEVVQKSNPVFTPVDITILSGQKLIPLKKGARIFNDRTEAILNVAPELKRLSGIQLNYKDQQQHGTTFRFKSDVPVKVLVGYFNGHSFTVLPAPSLETDASANDKGQAEIRIANAVNLSGFYPVNVYSYKYSAGEHELKLGKGLSIILGFIPAEQDILMRDAGMTGEREEQVDWLFY